MSVRLAEPAGGRGETLSRRAYRSIRDAIRTGALEAGRMYSENEFAASMGISRTPVREALIELEREGLIEIAPQRGFRLRVLTKAEQLEVLELLHWLETFVSERSTKHVMPTETAELRQLLMKQRESIDDPEAFDRYEEEFHLLETKRAGVPRAEEMVRNLRSAIWLMSPMPRPTKAEREHHIRVHEEILDAIERGDENAALAASKRHMERARQLVQQAVERKSD